MDGTSDGYSGTTQYPICTCHRVDTSQSLSCEQPDISATASTSSFSVCVIWGVCCLCMLALCLLFSSLVGIGVFCCSCYIFVVVVCSLFFVVGNVSLAGSLEERQTENTNLD